MADDIPLKRLYAVTLSVTKVSASCCSLPHWWPGISLCRSLRRHDCLPGLPRRALIA